MKNLNVNAGSTGAQGEIPAQPRARPSTAPEALTRAPRPRPSGPKHDGLCIETYQESHALTIVDKNRGKTLLDQDPAQVKPLSQCYCSCGSCWQPTGATRNLKGAPRQTGRCICRSCPCWTISLAQDSPTPSTRNTSSLKK